MEALVLEAVAELAVRESRVTPKAELATGEERGRLRERFPFIDSRKTGGTIDAVTLKRDAGGLFVHTHRARSKSYPSVDAIPESAVRFIESTG